MISVLAVVALALLLPVCGLLLAAVPYVVAGDIEEFWRLLGV